VAVANVHGVGNILTFNVADFITHYANITVIDPASLLP
jgi:hypothetical protein